MAEVAQGEPASPTSAAPGNQDSWHKMTEKNMLNSRNFVRDMLSRVRQNDIEEAASKAQASEFAKMKAMEAKNVVYTKAATHHKVIDTSFKCMQAMDDATLQMEDSHIKLKHQRMQGFAALQVCTRRLELREKRPAAETFADAVNEALLSEKKILDGARGDLMNLEGEAKRLIEDLAAMRRYLSMDTGERRLEMAHDLSSLKLHLAPLPQPAKGGAAAGGAEGTAGDGAAEGGGAEGGAEKEEAAPPPAAAPAAEAPPAEASATDNAAPLQKLDPKKLTEEANKLLSRCSNLRMRVFALIDKIQIESKRALDRCETVLQRRCTDLANKKKHLEMHALDVEAAIATAERSLDRLQKRLDPKDSKKAERLSHDFAALDQLRKSRVALQEDIRNKFMALDVDNLCRRVTPAKADSAKRQSQQATQLSRSSSAPGLIKKKEFGGTGTDSLGTTGSTYAPSSVKPASPAGGSSALRAAGAAGLQ